VAFAEPWQVTQERRKRAAEMFPALGDTDAGTQLQIDNWVSAGNGTPAPVSDFTQLATALGRHAAELSAPEPDVPDAAPNVSGWEPNQAPQTFGEPTYDPSRPDPLLTRTPGLTPLETYQRTQQASLGFFTGANPMESVRRAGRGLEGEQFSPYDLGFVRNLEEGDPLREPLARIESQLVDPINLATMGQAGAAKAIAVGIGAEEGARALARGFGASPETEATIGAIANIGGNIVGPGLVNRVAPRATTWMEAADNALAEASGATEAAIRRQAPEAFQSGRVPGTDELFTFGPQGENVGPTGAVREIRLGREPVVGENVNRGLRYTNLGRAEMDQLAAADQAAFQSAYERSIAGAERGIGGGADLTPADFARLAAKKAAGEALTPEEQDSVLQALGKAMGATTADEQAAAREALYNGPVPTDMREVDTGLIEGMRRRLGAPTGSTVEDALRAAREGEADPFARFEVPGETQPTPIPADRLRAIQERARQVANAQPNIARMEQDIRSLEAIRAGDAPLPEGWTQDDVAGALTSAYRELENAARPGIGGGAERSPEVQAAMDRFRASLRRERTPEERAAAARAILSSDPAELQTAARPLGAAVDDDFETLMARYSTQGATDENRTLAYKLLLRASGGRGESQIRAVNSVGDLRAQYGRMRQSGPRLGGGADVPGEPVMARNEFGLTPEQVATARRLEDAQRAQQGLPPVGEQKPPTLRERAGRIASEAASFPMSAASTYDVSAPGRQLAPFLYAHPTQIVPVLKAQFGGMKSATFEAAQEALAAKPYAKLRDLAGVELTDVGKDMTKREEQIASVFAEKVLPKSKNFNQGYTLAINEARDWLFKSILDQVDPALLTPEGLRNGGTAELKRIGGLVNASTGRGSDLGGILRNNKIAGIPAFWAPRMLTGRVQLVTALSSESPTVRKEAARQLLAFVGANVALLTLAKASGAADVELDPRSSDFGQFQIGKRRYDPWAGYKPLVNLVARLGYGLTGEPNMKTVNKDGVEGDLYSKDNVDVIARFLRTKLSPIAGEGTSQVVGRDLANRDVKESTGGRLGHAAYQLGVPSLFLKSLVEEMMETVPRGYAEGGTGGAIREGAKSLIGNVPYALGTGGGYYEDAPTSSGGGGGRPSRARPSRPQRPSRSVR